MAITVDFIPNTENWTLVFQSIQKDYAFNDIDMYFNQAENEILYMTERRRKRKRYQFDVTVDDISVDGVPFAGTAEELATALEPIIHA